MYLVQNLIKMKNRKRTIVRIDKVNKFQNELLKSSFLPNYEPKIVLKDFCGRNDHFINSF
jgi:hypothetical protein